MRPHLTAASRWDAFRDTWLHIAAGVAQNRLPTVLVGPFVPEHLETLPGRELVGDIAYGVLDCPDDVSRARIEARPSWRLRDIDEQVAFGAWLRTNLAPVFDTGAVIPEETADAVPGWIPASIRSRRACSIRPVRVGRASVFLR